MFYYLNWLSMKGECISTNLPSMVIPPLNGLEVRGMSFQVPNPAKPRKTTQNLAKPDKRGRLLYYLVHWLSM